MEFTEVANPLVILYLPLRVEKSWDQALHSPCVSILYPPHTHFQTSVRCEIPHIPQWCRSSPGPCLPGKAWYRDCVSLEFLTVISGRDKHILHLASHAVGHNFTACDCNDMDLYQEIFCESEFTALIIVTCSASSLSHVPYVLSVKQFLLDSTLLKHSWLN